MRNNLLLKLLMTGALLILAIPIGASAQIFNRDRSYDRDQNDRVNRREVREAIQRLDSSAAQLESELSVTRGRRVLGLFTVGTRDDRAIAEVRDFRRAVRQLRNSATDRNGVAGSRDEARQVLDRGVQLDRYLRLRTGSARVDADLSEIRSSLHVIADAYNLRMPY